MKEDFFSLFLRNNGYFYYYVYDKFGRRVFRSTGEKRKGKAMEVALQRLKTGELLGSSIRKHLKFSEYAKDFWNYDTCPIVQDAILRGKHYSIEGTKNYERGLRNVVMPDWGKYFLEEITQSQIQMWLVKLPQRYNIAHKTANDHLLNIRQILAQAVRDGFLEKNPAEGVKQLSKETISKGTFTREQIRVLFREQWECLPAYAGCLLSAKTGMRMGEVRALTMEQLHDDYIDVNAAWAKGGEGRKTTKSGHSRVVPVEKELIQLLQKVSPQPKGLIFTGDGVTPCCQNYFSDYLKKKMKELGIPNVDENGLKLTFHSFRYFFNSRLVVANMAGEKIRATIGHESSEMTQHYTRLLPEDMEQIRLIQREIC